MTETRNKQIAITRPLYDSLLDLGNPGALAEVVLQSYVDQTKAMRDAQGPPERIVVIAATLPTANYWVKLNAKALGGTDGRGAAVITAGNADTDRLRGVQADRLIIIGPVDRDLEQEARICVHTSNAQVVRVTFSDRLATAWRDAHG